LEVELFKIDDGLDLAEGFWLFSLRHRSLYL
jgi:hypothetical protein